MRPNARRALRGADSNPKLSSGMSGSGGRVTSGNGHASHATHAQSHHDRRDTPYRVAGTTAGQWTTAVAHNTTRHYRNER